ncbi:MAG: PTS sugar transporter subunit IIA [Firmicutes bacterium]|jgi:mannitol/fructose-specific phosphotransferase system IIA component (Ntr-type)|nr:PTS sugar transporter subunit IIA [Bacillota bacterium]
MLGELLTRNTIELGVEAADWREAIERAGELLVKAGAVERRYIAAMIDMVRELGPYIVVAPGVAIPHARPENGVKTVCLSMVRLKSPVPFGNNDFDPVDLVFALGAVDDKSHLGAIAELAVLLTDGEALAAIRRAAGRDEVVEVIQARESGQQREGG